MIDHASLTRFGAMARLETGYILRRPPFWVWLGLLTLFAVMVASTGQDFMRSGDSAAGGVRTVITSTYAVTEIDVVSAVFFSTFFASIIAGLSPIRDDETGVGSILHGTPLRVGEYVWGKFVGIGIALATLTVLHALLTVIAYVAIPWPGAAAWRGPFHAIAYIEPVLAFTLPFLLFLTGVSYAVGSAFRQPILIFVLPFGLLVSIAVLTSTPDTHLSAAAQHYRPLFEPTGLMWLVKSYMETDRGVAFYNNGALPLPTDYIVSRIGMAALGLIAIGLGQWRLARELRSPSRRRVRRRSPEHAEPVAEPLPRARTAAQIPLANLEMRAGRPGLLRTAWAVMRAELAALARQPGLYLFLPLIVLICVSSVDSETGMFSARRILTPGYAAASQMSLVAVFTSLLLLAYTVETLERDQGCGLTAIRNALPVRTASLLIGKLGALCVVALLPPVAVALTLLITISHQGLGVPLSVAPFLLLWVAVLGPSFLLWILFVMAAYAFSGSNRYTTYSLGAMVLLVLLSANEYLSWATNVFLIDSLRWSDLAPMEMDGPALRLSRAVVLAAALCWLVVALIAFRRREPDITRRVGRLRFRVQARTFLPLVPPLVLFVILLVTLKTMIARGQDGETADTRAKDYWRRNFATFHDAPVPGIADVTMTLDLYPARRAYSGHGELTLTNFHNFPLNVIPITPGLGWENTRWTLDGQPYYPENRAGLLIVYPTGGPLLPGKTIRLGFSYESLDPGPTENGVAADAQMEFILSSAVVLTSLGNSMLPELGYDADIGVDKDNHFDAVDRTLNLEPRERGLPLFASATPFSLNLTLTAPANFTLSSVGELVSRQVSGTRQTEVWQAKRDPRAPVRAFNVVAGRHLTEARSNSGAIVRYYPGHNYNVREMLSALDAARENYGAWFAPYPWKDLKLTEFPDYAGYAQSFPSNISFGEGMGFLTRAVDEEGNASATDAFAVTAHESAHQWWGHMVLPGDGAGSNVLSEGLAHFSTVLLIEKIKGVGARQQFLREIETQYNKSRSPDSELALARMTSDKKGDAAVTYDKGGWVFTMLSERVMGRDHMLQGLRAYIAKYRDGGYHPDIADLLTVLRPYAPDPKRFDRFVNIWFYSVVMPEFQVSDATRKRAANGKWSVNFRFANIGTGQIMVPVEVQDENGHRSMVQLQCKDAAVLPITLTTDFEPTKIVVDPDVTVLQCGRTNAETTITDSR